MCFTLLGVEGKDICFFMCSCNVSACVGFLLTVDGHVHCAGDLLYLYICLKLFKTG